MLLEYPGTLILVSHDRAFLNNLVTSTLVLSGDGKANEFIGGYDGWQNKKEAEQKKQANSKKLRKASPPVLEEKKKAKKLNYKEQRELEKIPVQIEALETEQAQLNASLTDPSFYQKNNVEVSQAVERLKIIEETLEQVYSRWEELER